MDAGSLIVSTQDLGGSTPGPFQDPTHSTSDLTSDLHRDTSNRLRILALVQMLMIAVVLALKMVLFPVLAGTFPTPLEPWSIPFNFVALILSAVVYLLVRRHLDSPRIPRLGLAFFLATAVVVAAENSVGLAELGKDPESISGMCLWILFYPMVVPTPWKTTLVVSLIAAMLDPIGAAIMLYATRGEIASPFILFFWIASFICAFLAVVPAKIMEKLHRKVSEARELGSYRLEARIGRGGMGEVWRGRHALLARPAAVKIIRPDSLGAIDSQTARTTLARFEREARATALLESPHSIEIFDFGLSHGTFYYVMELLNGFDLDTLVRQHGPIPPERVIHVLEQVCHSLADAHERGLVHRDIKPANIFTCRKGRDVDFIKVLDFGLVKSTSAGVGGGGGVDVTGPGVATGTPAFMAPEQVVGDALDLRADIYSLGCVAYWLVTGRLVFDVDNPMKMAMAHVRDVPAPPSKWSEEGVPADLEAVIMRCLEKEPERRPANAVRLSEMLGDCGGRDRWTSDRATAWWNLHMPRSSDPPTLTVSSEQGGAREVPAT